MRNPLMISLCILIWATAFKANGQLKVYIEDKTGAGFFLGLNDYLQHPERQERLLLTNIDTIPYKLQVEQDTVNFQRKLHLRKTGVHHFVLVKNFRGELKLRYRGDAIPGGEYTEVAYHTDVPWPQDWKPSPTRASVNYWTAARARHDQNLSATIQEEPLPADDTLEVIVTNPNDTSGVLRPDNDTIQKSAVVVREPEEEEIPPFEQLISDLQQKQFEFEKMKLAKEFTAQQQLSIEEIRQILKQFRYDHSKLELLENATSYALNPHRLMELKNELDYVLSQQKFEMKIKNEK